MAVMLDKLKVPWLEDVTMLDDCSNIRDVIMTDLTDMRRPLIPSMLTRDIQPSVS